MDDQIKKAREQALSRKEILDKVDKWRVASEEELWLDDYERVSEEGIDLAIFSDYISVIVCIVLFHFMRNSYYLEVLTVCMN